MPTSDTPFLDFAADDSLTGFRLQRLELYNWGTFNNRVWTLRPEGQNCLLTGDIGSGKSTIVDAVTTLLVPPNRVSYNKAAGAAHKERDLRSYVLGYYRTERADSGSAAKPVGLRDAHSFSVILAVFHNSGFDQTITLACVLWMGDPTGQPKRFYLASENALSITADFSGFDADINKLRRRLRDAGAHTFPSFAEYCAWFRRRMGIGNEQALDLFHQTISMKSVGNLTEFVRNHMLEPFDVQARIEGLITHFDDLDRAFAAVQRAKRQIELLTPIAADADHHDALSTEVSELRQARDFLAAYFATHKLGLLEVRAKSLAADQQRQHESLQAISAQIVGFQSDQADLRHQIAENGGDRIAILTTRIAEYAVERDRRKGKADRYTGLLDMLDEAHPQDANSFLDQHRRIADLRSAADDALADLQNRITADTVEMHQLQEKTNTLAEEIDSLKARRSNIPRKQIAIRQLLTQELALDPTTLPFVGELLAMDDGERDWEPAAERLLHNFGLSLLVPDRHYTAVMEWVDRTHLRGRLVYFRVLTQRNTTAPDLHPQSIVRKLRIKRDTPHYDWLEQELAHRFDFACCTGSDQFRREARAITRHGQTKSPGGRHEKDDRHRIDDRSRYILGWTNEAKIAALESEKSQLNAEGNTIVARLNAHTKEQRTVNERLTLLTRLEEYREFREIDWQSIAQKIADDEIERHRLETSSDILRQLNEKLRNIEADIAAASEKKSTKERLLGSLENRIETNDARLGETRDLLAETDAAALSEWHDRLDSIRQKAIADHEITIEGCDTREKETREWLQNRIDSRDRAAKTVRDRLITLMGDFCREFVVETREIDPAIESADEYRQLLHRLQDDDLPRFESKFKDLLNQNTIREIANFNAHLNQQREIIRERVDRINQSLTEIDYNPGRYITLESTAVSDHDIRSFQTELRSCTEGALTGSEDDQYSESKFLQVKEIIERFRGREGTTDLDRRWTSKVTDVRNWFTFAASERWREDDSEHEHYSDSGGKSGGQKEKLAYTILAASLAYQFGLEWGRVRSRSFRFVVIDEAFGRGSDESAQYGLKLFSQLNLQLLIVTPLQKIHIIEPYVHSVGFVHNQDGRDSQLRNLSIDEYRAEKAANQSKQPE